MFVTGNLKSRGGTELLLTQAGPDEKSCKYRQNNRGTHILFLLYLQIK